MLATDRSLPETFQRELEGEIDPSGIRKTQPAEAPGHRPWLSVTLSSPPGECFLSTNPEYMELLVARAPYRISAEAGGRRRQQRP